MVDLKTFLSKAMPNQYCLDVKSKIILSRFWEARNPHNFNEPYVLYDNEQNRKSLNIHIASFLLGDLHTQAGGFRCMFNWSFFWKKNYKKTL